MVNYNENNIIVNCNTQNKCMLKLWYLSDIFFSYNAFKILLNGLFLKDENLTKFW